MNGIFENNEKSVELVDKQILDEVRKFHLKGAFAMEALSDPDRLERRRLEHLISISQQLISQPKYNSGARFETCPVPDQRKMHTSAKHFCVRSGFWLAIKKCISNSFSIIGQDAEGKIHRSYPSGGGLYPVQIFLIVYEQDNLVDRDIRGLYLFSPRDYRLHRVKAELPNLRTVQKPSGQPNCQLVYCIDNFKALIKYGFRGYRHAVAETGIMIERMSHESKEENLVNIAWSSFDDLSLTDYLEINPERFLVCLTQFVGYPQ